ncbi:MAG: L-threonylcarbamoyladenylate synthase [Nannocystaceae bacterium]
MSITPIRGADPRALAEAAAILRRGGLVAFPTETVYGLGADGLDAAAVARIFAAKGRPADNPLILHVGDLEQAIALTPRLSPLGRTLAAAFWPGPLTLVLPRGPGIPSIVTAGLDTVAVRVPDHPIALALLRAFGRPLAAPSANRSGRPSPTTAAHVLADFDGRIDMVIDGGPTTRGIESTVIDLADSSPILLRQGALPREAIEARIGPLRVLRADDEAAAARSPGLRHRHYAPQARVVVVPADALAARARQLQGQGKRVAAIVREAPVPADVRGWRAPSDLEGYARELYAALRGLDRRDVDVILAEAVPEVGIGRAIMDRLRRAAT